MEFIDLPITTEVFLYNGIKRVDIKVRVMNNAKDHRLRTIFQTKIPCKSHFVESHFHILERVNKPYQGKDWPEILTGDYPMGVWIDITDNNKGFALVTRGLNEYAVSDSGEIYLTLLRCVGQLSKDKLKTRPAHAGPPIPTPNAQNIGEHTLYYSLIPHENSWREALVHKLAREYHAPLMALELEKSFGTLPTKNSFIEISSNNGILTSFKAGEDMKSIIIRCYSLNEENIELKLNRLIREKVQNMYLSNLSEEEEIKIPHDDIINLKPKPWQIITLKGVLSA